MVVSGFLIVTMARILLVDDFEELRSLMIALLGDTEHEIVAAYNGLEGLEAVREEDFDIVITDLIMPEMDGLKFIEWLREHKPDTKIIAISGGKAVIPGVYLQAAKAAGATTTLEKPYGRAELIEAIEKASAS